MSDFRISRQPGGLPQPQRTCRAPGCDVTLPTDAHPSAKYCVAHVEIGSWGRRRYRKGAAE